MDINLKITKALSDARKEGKYPTELKLSKSDFHKYKQEVKPENLNINPNPAFTFRNINLVEDESLEEGEIKY